MNHRHNFDEKKNFGLCLFGASVQGFGEYVFLCNSDDILSTHTFNAAYTQTHTHTYIYIHTHAHTFENRPEKSLLFINEARTLIVMSGAICRQAIKVFPALKQCFDSHKYKDESETDNRCSMVLGTQGTIFHQHGTEKLLSGHANVAGTIWKSNGLAVGGTRWRSG